MDPNSPSSIAERLCADIRRGAIAVNAVLQQEELAARFGVSRQPVRLAMESLRAAGWLEPGKGRSLKVVEMTAEALRDLVAVRRLVEGEALALAMPRRDDRDVLEAGHLQERIEAETDPQALEELDAAFHTVLYRAGAIRGCWRWWTSCGARTAGPIASSSRTPRSARSGPGSIAPCSTPSVRGTRSARRPPWIPTSPT